MCSIHFEYLVIISDKKIMTCNRQVLLFAKLIFSLEGETASKLQLAGSENKVHLCAAINK